MKKLLAVLLSVIIMTTCFSMTGSAIATELVAGNSMETATNIPQFGVDYVSTLSKANEVDWFKFTTLPNEAFYDFYFENYSLANTGSWSVDSDYSPQLYLYDINMKELDSCFTDGDKNGGFNLKLETNTVFYFKILMGKDASTSTGNYQVTISAREDEIPDTLDRASEVQINATNVNSLDGYADVDWYKFTTSKHDVEYRFFFENYTLANTSSWSVDSDYSPQLYLYDRNMKQVGFCYTGGNKTGEFTVDLDPLTEYYFKVLMGNNNKDSVGTYAFTISANLPDTPTAKTLSAIRIDSLPNKTTYQIGEAFDDRGLSVRAFYSDGTTRTVSAYSISGFNSSTAGEKTLTVSYSEGGNTVYTTFKITVASGSSQPDPDPNPDPGHQVEKDVFMQIIEALESFFVQLGNFFRWLIGFIIDILSA